MKLLIVSHTPHYQRDGSIVGWGPTVREIDYLSHLFESIVHLAPLHTGGAPTSSMPYRSTRIRLALVKAAGGLKLADKLGIVASLPSYVSTLLREVDAADAVHVRCPSNISMLAVGMLTLLKRKGPRWIKYAGNWKPDAAEPWSYRLQRWCLSRNIARALVTVNGDWPDQPQHVRAFFNPSLTDEELQAGRVAAASKTLSLDQPARLVIVGRLEADKGVGRVIEIIEELARRGANATLEIVGDGPERETHREAVRRAGLNSKVVFHGWLTRPELNSIYERSHFVVMPTVCSEGWPKVLSEGMAYGAIPLASTVSSIPQILRSCGIGRSLDANDVGAYASAIEEYRQQPEKWASESVQAVNHAPQFGYSHYLSAVHRLFEMPESGFASAGAMPVFKPTSAE